MESKEILSQLNNVFRDVFDNDKIVVDDKTIAADIEDWDSLNHIELVVAIEKHFKVKFPTSEINGWTNVGDMVASIGNRIK